MAGNPSDPRSYFDSDAQTSIHSIKRITATGVFSDEGSRSPFFEPCVTRILIELSDLLQKANATGKRVTFTEDVQITDRVKDVTDLVRDCRNAACHISSGQHIFERNKFVFNVIIGLMPRAIEINGQVLGCDYPDDIAVYWGGMRLYLNRHVMRSLAEAEAAFPNPWLQRVS